MKKVSELVKQVAVQLIEVQNFPVGLFFNKQRLSQSMLIAHREIVIEWKFYIWRHLPTLLNLPNRKILPIFLPALLYQLKVHAVQALIYGICDYRLLSAQLFVNFQQIYLQLVVG